MNLSLANANIEIDQDVATLRTILKKGFGGTGAKVQDLDQYGILAARMNRESLHDEAPSHARHDLEQAAVAIERLLTTVVSLVEYARITSEGVAESGDYHRALVAHLLHTRAAFLDWFEMKRFDVQSSIPNIFENDDQFPELLSFDAVAFPASLPTPDVMKVTK